MTRDSALNCAKLDCNSRVYLVGGYHGDSVTYFTVTNKADLARIKSDNYMDFDRYSEERVDLRTV